MGADEPGVAVGEDAAQRRQATEVRDRRDPAELEGEARPRSTRCSAIANAARFIIIMWPAFLARVSPVTRNAKPDLHEQHEEAGEQQPREVDRHPEMARFVGEFVDARPGTTARFALVVPLAVRYVRGISCGHARRVAVMARIGRSDDDQDYEREQAQRDELLASRQPVLPSSAAIGTHGKGRMLRPRARRYGRRDSSQVTAL